MLFFVYCAFGGSILDNEIIIDIPSCDISTRNQEINKKDILNEIYVVGHAYGKPGEGDFFPNNLTSFFDRNLTNNLSYIALTGDFVTEPTEESYEKVKLYIEKEFQDYFIAMGNHEIKNSGLTNYYKF